MDENFEEFYDDAIRIWGDNAQIGMCIEEMSELTKELCKYLRYTDDDIKRNDSEKIKEVKNNIIEETADVLNCVSQMSRMFGDDEVLDVRISKRARTFLRLDNYKKSIGCKDVTLVYAIKDGKVLLGEKLRGFGKGKFNGAGGKVEFCETIEDCAKRELKEEFGIEAKSLSHVGDIFYDEYNASGDKVYFDTHVFIVTDYAGEPNTSDEMEPKWFDIENLPTDKLFGDDIFWLKEVLNGKKVNARFVFDKEFNIINKSVYFK